MVHEKKKEEEQEQEEEEEQEGGRGGGGGGGGRSGGSHNMSKFCFIAGKPTFDRRKMAKIVKIHFFKRDIW